MSQTVSSLGKCALDLPAFNFGNALSSYTDDKITALLNKAAEAIFDHDPKRREVLKNLPSQYIAPRYQGRLTFSSPSSSELCNGKSEMQDAHFMENGEHYSLLGVFDGHRKEGKKVAEFLKQYFPIFFHQTEQKCSDIPENFSKTFNDLHDCLSADGGAPAFVCYVDKKNNLLFSSTIGDSEGRLYRKMGEKFEVIPLSCKKDWSTPEEEERAHLAVEQSGAYFILKGPKARHRYFGKPSVSGINLSRSIGDKSINAEITLSGKRVWAISHEAETNLQTLYKGDTLVVGSDGLWSAISDEQVMMTIKNPITVMVIIYNSLINHCLPPEKEEIEAAEEYLSVLARIGSEEEVQKLQENLESKWKRRLFKREESSPDLLTKILGLAAFYFSSKSDNITVLTMQIQT